MVTDAYNILEQFFTVVKDQEFPFDQKTIADLSTLKQTLAELENQPLSEAAEAIRNWCKEHPQIRDVVLRTLRGVKIQPRNPANQEGTLINQFPDYKKIIDDRQNNPPSAPKEEGTR